jgi:flavorubredoxin
MTARIDEIAEDIYRISTYTPDGPPGGICFNQYLVVDEEPVLVHTGMRMHARQTIAAVAAVLPPSRLRWITSNHASRPDEFGALDAWFAVAPHAEIFHGRVGCWVNLADASDRRLRPLDDGDVVAVGEHRLRWWATPHVPGPWEAGVLVEEATGTMFCGDLLAQAGEARHHSTAEDVVGPAIELETVTHGVARTPDTGPTLERLASRQPNRLALMHGPVFTGDTSRALNDFGAWLAGSRSGASGEDGDG